MCVCVWFPFVVGVCVIGTLVGRAPCARSPVVLGASCVLCVFSVGLLLVRGIVTIVPRRVLFACAL